MRLFAPSKFDYASDYLFLIGGQSNVGTDPATGRVALNLMPGTIKSRQSNVLVFNTTSLKYETYTHPVVEEWGFLDQFVFTESLRENRTIYFYKHGLGGSRLAESGSGAAFDRNVLKQNGSLAITEFLKRAKNPKIVMLFSLGTTDGIDSNNSVEYYYNLKDFHEEVRTYWKLPELPIIYERLSSSCTSTFLSNIRSNQALVQALDPIKNIMVDSDDCEYQGDGAHYNEKGAVRLGKRFSGRKGVDGLRMKYSRSTTFNVTHLDPKIHCEARKINVANVEEIRDSAGQKFCLKLNDLTGNLRRLKDLTTTHQPELINAGTDAAYLLAATNSSLGSASYLAQDFCQTDFEMYFYIDIADGNPAAQRIWMESSSGGDFLSVYQEGVSPFKIVARLTGNVSIFTKTNGGPFADGATGKHVVNIRVSYTNNQVSIYVDGAQQTLDASFPGNISTLTPSSLTPGLFNLFARQPYSAAGGFDGKLYAFTIFARTLTANERVKVDKYYSW